MTERLIVTTANADVIELDLYPKTKVSMNFTLNDLGDISTRNSTFSNTIKVPRTGNNMKALSNVGTLGDASSAPYTNIDCDYYIGDTMVISGGFLQILGYDAADYHLALFDGILSLAQVLGSDKLVDLDLSTFTHTRSEAQIELDIQLTAYDDGYAYPLYSAAETTTTYWGLTTPSVTLVEHMVPVMFVWTLLDKIMSGAGFTWSGDLKTDASLLVEVITLKSGLTDESLDNFWEIGVNDELITPDISQIDFVKDILLRYGQILRRVGNDIEFIGIDTLISGANGFVDWTEKVIGTPSVKFDNTYAKDNLFTFDYEDAENADRTIKVEADASILLTNVYLKPSVTIHTAPYDWGGDGLAAYADRDSITKVDVEECILYDTADAGVARTPALYKVEWDSTYKWNLRGGITEVPQTGVYFLDDSETLMEYYLTNYYAKFRVLMDEYKKVTVSLNLNPIEISQLDLFKIVYLRQTGRYYYVDKLQTKGLVSKATLTEIPTGVITL